jgi:hypothetical protein
MRAKLRNEALAHGWPEDIVRHLAVHHKDGQFSVHAHDTHRKEVLDLEYGTPTQRPTAVIRKFNNRQSDAQNFLMLRFNKHMGWTS